MWLVSGFLNFLSLYLDRVKGQRVLTRSSTIFEWLIFKFLFKVLNINFTTEIQFLIQETPLLLCSLLTPTKYWDSAQLNSFQDILFLTNTFFQTARKVQGSLQKKVSLCTQMGVKIFPAAPNFKVWRREQKVFLVKITPIYSISYNFSNS